MYQQKFFKKACTKIHFDKETLNLTCDMLPWMAARSLSNCILGDILPDACMEADRV